MACPNLAFGCFLHAIVYLVPSVVGQGTSEWHTHLVQGLAAVHQHAHRLRVLQALLQLLQLQIRRTKTLILPERREGLPLPRDSPKEMQPPPEPHPWLTHRGLGRQGLNAGSMGGDGQDVELVINDETLLTRGQRKNKSEEQNRHTEVLGRGPMSTQQRCGFLQEVSEEARESQTQSERTRGDCEPPLQDT